MKIPDGLYMRTQPENARVAIFHGEIYYLKFDKETHGTYYYNVYTPDRAKKIDYVDLVRDFWTPSHKLFDDKLEGLLND